MLAAKIFYILTYRWVGIAKTLPMRTVFRKSTKRLMAIESLRLIDHSWYSTRYRDTEGMNERQIELHFSSLGWREGRQCSPWFRFSQKRGSKDEIPDPLTLNQQTRVFCRLPFITDTNNRVAPNFEDEFCLADLDWLRQDYASHPYSLLKDLISANQVNRIVDHFEQVYVDDVQVESSHSFESRLLHEPFVKKNSRQLSRFLSLSQSNKVSLKEAKDELELGKKLVSIVIATEGKRESLIFAIQSALSQTYEKVEVILVLDGLSEVPAYLEDAKSKIKCFCISDKIGVSRARNLGAHEAKGDFLVFLDDDNLITAKHLEIGVSKLEMDLSQVYYSGQVRWNGMDFSTAFPASFNSYLYAPFNYARLLNHNFIDMNTAIISKSAFHDIGGFDETLERFVDWDLFLRLGSTNKFSCLPVPTSYYYDLGKASITSDRSPSWGTQVLRKADSRGTRIKTSGNVAVLKTSVIVPMFGYTNRLYGALEELLNNDSVTHIILEDDSYAPNMDLEFLARSNDKILYTHNADFARGFSHSVDRGLKKVPSECEMLLIMNDDVSPSANWWVRASDIFQTNANVSAIVPAEMRQGRSVMPHVIRRNKARPIDVTLSKHHKNYIRFIPSSDGLFEISYAPLFSVLVNLQRVPLEKITMYKDFSAHYMTDHLFCRDLREYGTLVYDSKLIFEHIGGASQLNEIKHTYF